MNFANSLGLLLAGMFFFPLQNLHTAKSLWNQLTVLYEDFLLIKKVAK